MNKIFSKFVNYGFGIFFALAMALSVYFLADWLLVEHYISSQAAVYGVILLIALAACAGCLALRKLGNVFEARLGDDAKKCDRIFAIMALALLAVQIIFAACSHFTPINDLSYICTSAKNYILMGADTIYEGLPSRHQEYYAVYPNNHLLFLIVLALYKIQYALTGHITNVLPTAFNLIGLNASYILMYMCARVIYKPSKALLCAVRGLLFTPLMTYVMYFYTDALGMPWLTGALYLYLKWRSRRAEGEKLLSGKSAALLISCGAVLGIAYKIKGSAVILLPAILLDLLFQQKGAKGLLSAIKAKLAPFAAILAVFAVVSALIGSLACSVLKISKDELYKYSFPTIHWVMMSADGKGGYNYDDFMYTRSFEGKDEKKRADLERLNEKIHEQGASGMLNHCMLKLTYTWKLGTYMINYYMTDSKLLTSKAFLVICTALHFTLMLSMVSTYLSRLKSNDDVLQGDFILKVTLMGLTVFLMLWEARCRYLVSFFVLFALL